MKNTICDMNNCNTKVKSDELYLCEICKKKYCVNCMYLFCKVCKKYYTCYTCGVEIKYSLEIENILDDDRLKCSLHNN